MWSGAFNTPIQTLYLNSNRERQMGRKPCCDKEGLNKGAWSAWEDKALANYINTHGEGKWRDLPQRAGTYGSLFELTITYM